MNKETLVKKYAGKMELTQKEALVQVDALLDSIVEGLEEDGKVTLVGFGNFVVKERAARKGRNPQTNEEIEIAASKVPAWKPSKTLKSQFK